MRDHSPPHGTYVGEYYSLRLEARPLHFSKPKDGKYVSNLQEEIQTKDVRAFQVAVLVMPSEKERKDLEEYVIVSLIFPYYFCMCMPILLYFSNL